MQILKRMLPYYVASIVLAAVCSLAVSQAVTAHSAVTVSAEWTVLPTVVVDPGHGGEDGGAVSPGGVLESGLTV